MADRATKSHSLARVGLTALAFVAFFPWSLILAGVLFANGLMKLRKYQIGRASCRERV